MTPDPDSLVFHRDFVEMELQGSVSAPMEAEWASGLLGDVVLAVSWRVMAPVAFEE